MRAGQSACGCARTRENQACVPHGEYMSSNTGLRNGRNPSLCRRSLIGSPQLRVTRLAKPKNRCANPGTRALSGPRYGAPGIAGGSSAERKIDGCSATDIQGFYRPFNVTEKVATESWHGEGTSNSLPLLSWNDAPNNKQMSTRFLESGDYLKLKNIQLGYSLGSPALSRVKIKSMRIYVSAQNVFTITKYSGQDPEMTTSADAASSGDGPKALNIDWGTYPSARTYTIGANINF